MLLAGVAGLTVRSLRMLLLAATFAASLRNSWFRVRWSRLAGEVVLAIVVAFASHELFFYGGKLVPDKAMDATLHIHLPFLGWFGDTFGTALLAIGAGLVVTIVIVTTVLQYNAVAPLRKPYTGRHPMFVRLALFSTTIVFCEKRSALTWLRTEAVCLGLAVLLRMGGGVSEAEMTNDKLFRRLLGPSALDWSTLVATAQRVDLQLASDLSELVEDPLGERVGIPGGHAGH
jgi:hypothetical protein